MKKSELKEIIKSSILNEYEEDYERESRKIEYGINPELLDDEFLELPEPEEKYGNPEYWANLDKDEENLSGMMENEATAVVDTDDPKSPILKKLLKKHKVTMVQAPGFGKFKLTGPLKGLKAVLQDEEGWGINDLHNYIKESKEDVEDTEEDIDVDVEGDIDLADVEPEASGDKGDIQSNLQAALQAAKAIGDQKLVDQIGNTITFFTRTHVVGDGDSVEEDINLDESLNRMQKLAGIIK